MRHLISVDDRINKHAQRDFRTHVQPRSPVQDGTSQRAIGLSGQCVSALRTASMNDMPTQVQ
jgi:hypothetical protein